MDAGILAKGAMRHFWKIANRAIVAFTGKILVKIPGKISGEIVLREKSDEVDHHGIENLREPNFAGGTEANR